MLLSILILLLNLATLLLALATASRGPSRSAYFTVGVALMACLAAGEQVIGQRSTPAVFVLTVVLDAVLLGRLMAARRATRRPTPRR